MAALSPSGSSAVFGTNSIRTSEANIMTTEAPPTAHSMAGGMSQIGSSSSAPSLSDEALAAGTATAVVLTSSSTFTPTSSANKRTAAPRLDPHQLGDDMPTARETLPAVTNDSVTNTTQQQQEQHQQNIAVAATILPAFDKYKEVSYLGANDDTADDDIIAVAFGTFDTALGNNIDYHYPPTACTTSTNNTNSSAGNTTNTNTNSSTKRCCSIDFNKLNEFYKLQDFCFPDGSHDSFVDTVPFVVSSCGSVKRLGSGGSRSVAATTDTEEATAVGVGSSSSSTSPANPYPIFGFACYHLFKDPSVHRGAVQRSFLVLSRRPLFYCMRRIARQAMVPFLDVVPSTDLLVHRRFVRALFDALHTAFKPLIGCNPPPAPASDGNGSSITATTPVASSSADPVRQQIAEALADADFSPADQALRDVKYFSLTFSWTKGGEEGLLLSSGREAGGVGSSVEANTATTATTATAREGSPGLGRPPLPPSSPHSPPAAALQPPSRMAVINAASQPNPEELPFTPSIPMAIAAEMREKSPTVGAAGGPSSRRGSTVPPASNSLSHAGSASDLASVVGGAGGTNASSSAGASAASDIASNGEVGVLAVESKAVGQGLSACEVEVPLLIPTTSAAANPAAQGATSRAASPSPQGLPSVGGATPSSPSGAAAVASQRPTSLQLSLHMPLILPRRDASFIQQLAFGSSLKTLLRWFGDKLPTIHYCMLARYPILFVGQHADEVSMAVCASAHLLDPFVGGTEGLSLNSPPTSDAAFNASGGYSNSNRSRATQPTSANASFNTNSNAAAGGNTANVTTRNSTRANAGCGGVQLDVCAFLPYATLDMMDRVQEVVANPSYNNITVMDGKSVAGAQSVADDNASASTAPPVMKHGGNGVGYYAAVGATNVFIVNKDVRGMLKCNVNDGTVTYCNNSNIKKSIGESKGLAESRRLWQAGALCYLSDKFFREAYYRLFVQKLNLEIKAECDARLSTGPHFKSLMLGGLEGSQARGNQGGVMSLFVNMQQHVVTMEDSEGFLLIDEYDGTRGAGKGGFKPTTAYAHSNTNARGRITAREADTVTNFATDPQSTSDPQTSQQEEAGRNPILEDFADGIGVDAADPLSLLRPTESNPTGAEKETPSSNQPTPSNTNLPVPTQQQQPIAMGQRSASLLPSAHVEVSDALRNFHHLAVKNRRLLTELDVWYQRLIAALIRTVAVESGEDSVAFGQELTHFSACEDAIAGVDESLELCASRPIHSCLYQQSLDRETRLRITIDYKERAYCFIDVLTRGNYRALVRRSNLYVSDFFLANIEGAEVYSLSQQVVLYQSDCQQVLYANRVKYKTSGTVYLTRNFLLFQASKLSLTKRHQIIPYDLLRGVSRQAKGLLNLFDTDSVKMMVDMTPDRRDEFTHGTAGPTLIVDKKNMNETTALLAFTHISNNAESFFDILQALYMKQQRVIKHLQNVPPLHTIPEGGAERMRTVGGTEMVCPIWIPRGLYTIANNIVYDEVWENQRLYPLLGWKSRLLPSDPASFSDFSGLRALSCDNKPPMPCPAGFVWIDAEWRLATDLPEEEPTTDKLLATNRGSHKSLPRCENKFDQGFLYGIGSSWTVADGFRTHECAGGVIRRRLWVRRRRLITNPQLEAYNEAKKRAALQEREQQQQLQQQHVDPTSNDVADANGQQPSSVAAAGRTRARAGRITTGADRPRLSEALLKTLAPPSSDGVRGGRSPLGGTAAMGADRKRSYYERPVSVSTDSTDVIDPNEVDESLSAPIAEENDVEAGSANQQQQQQEAADREVTRRALIDAEGNLPPNWEGHRRPHYFDRDESL